MCEIYFEVINYLENKQVYLGNNSFASSKVRFYIGFHNKNWGHLDAADIVESNGIKTTNNLLRYEILIWNASILKEL